MSSGNCEGYVLTQCLCFGEEAEALAQEVGTDNLLTGYTIAEIAGYRGRGRSCKTCRGSKT